VEKSSDFFPSFSKFFLYPSVYRKMKKVSIFSSFLNVERVIDSSFFSVKSSLKDPYKA